MLKGVLQLEKLQVKLPLWLSFRLRLLPLRIFSLLSDIIHKWLFLGRRLVNIHLDISISVTTCFNMLLLL